MPSASGIICSGPSGKEDCPSKGADAMLLMRSSPPGITSISLRDERHCSTEASSPNEPEPRRRFSNGTSSAFGRPEPYSAPAHTS